MGTPQRADGEVAGAGIVLNAIAPAVVVSPMTEQLHNNPEGLAQLEQVPMPLNGWLEPEQAAEMLAALTSVENTHLCGQVIFVDGGHPRRLYVVNNGPAAPRLGYAARAR